MIIFKSTSVRFASAFIIINSEVFGIYQEDTAEVPETVKQITVPNVNQSGPEASVKKSAPGSKEEMRVKRRLRST
ncbi:unnamed protein product [Dicrocoelium dendriticum]|nr:unnamed protein product [Dicrocoelium dendriticum]